MSLERPDCAPDSSHICNPLNLTGMRACQLNGTEWWSGARSIFISLFYARVATGVIIYRASHNWQRFSFFFFFLFFSPPTCTSTSDPRWNCIFQPRLGLSTGRVQPGFPQLQRVSQDQMKEREKRKREEEISRHSRWGRGIRSGAEWGQITS